MFSPCIISSTLNQVKSEPGRNPLSTTLIKNIGPEVYHWNSDIVLFYSNRGRDRDCSQENSDFQRDPNILECAGYCLQSSLRIRVSTLWY